MSPRLKNGWFSTRMVIFLCISAAYVVKATDETVLREIHVTDDMRVGDGDVIHGNFSTPYHGYVKQGEQVVYLFKVHDGMNKSSAVRIHVNSSNAEGDYPVLFVVRQQKGIMSWPIPMYILSLYKYDAVARTLCPMDFGDTIINEVYIDVSCSSPHQTNYTLVASLINDFEMHLSDKQTVTVAPPKPKYFYFNFPGDVDAVQVRASSEDRICATLSVQDTTCPVFDLNRNVEFTGIYQTMTTQTAITVQDNDFSSKEFYVVAVVHPDDAECNGLTELQPPSSSKTLMNINDVYVVPPRPTYTERIKTMDITIEITISKDQYWKAVLFVTSFFMCFYFVGLILVLVEMYRKRNVAEDDPDQEEREPILGPSEDVEAPISNAIQPSYGSAEMRHPGELPSYRGNHPPPNVDGHTSPTHQRRYSSDSSLDDDDIDMLHDIEEEKDIYRTKTFLYVSDLARKDRKTLRKKYKLYHWNLLPISIFYALPVIQLVITYQTIFNKTGDEDICYYNFLCANPLGVISAFNNIFSNIGYILLGILFLFVVWREDLLHKKKVEKNDIYEKEYGIPKHFGLFYAIGIALVMEGFLSGCYHVCPTYSNFQFDTSFMYIIAGLGMLKLYQTRHPDINANAYIAYACFALIIFMAVLGVVFGTIYFWIVFAVLHILTCCVLSAQIYYMGRWKLDLGIFKRIYLVMKTDCLKCTRPIYMDRMILLITGNVINWSLAIFGVISQPKDFASFMLAILIINSMLYLAFYIIMKLRSKERIVLRAFVFICLTVGFWGAALYFFMQGLSQWDKTPAVSREGNRDCILLDFYDHHDVWHFLSACAMFFSFMSLMTLDDDLDRTKRCKIPVF
ncbi:SID1 transmembrane family member 1-like [Glandiceps talaboti]